MFEISYSNITEACADLMHSDETRPVTIWLKDVKECINIEVLPNGTYLTH